ncbi:MAG: nicotinate (nicotinamide) nucleotide adenylyltransferase [Chlamydiales bacterium]|nr:nicotinate (nicotinamide) nucleotide adenylyltransferase [Chlamydiales bacterium]
MRKRVGLFGGTFDPIHFGHLNLALSLQEAHSLDEILFCPAALSPFKGAIPPHATEQARKEMVLIAIENIQSFSFLQSELERKGLSYTIDTIMDVEKTFERRKEEVDLFLLFGEDALAHFHLWKDVEKILEKTTPLIGKRQMKQKIVPLLEWSPSTREALLKGMTDIPILDISSTLIRKRLKEGRYCGHLAPSDVLHFIHTHKLYAT